MLDSLVLRRMLGGPGVLAGQCFEQALEWAIEHDADTYSMSFSRANLGEYRSHWRKACEHASLCGAPSCIGCRKLRDPRNHLSTNQFHRKCPFHKTFLLRCLLLQVCSVIYQEHHFPVRGRLEWKTHHYQDGRVKKPEVAAFNFRLPSIQPNGRVLQSSSKWKFICWANALRNDCTHAFCRSGSASMGNTTDSYQYST